MCTLSNITKPTDCSNASGVSKAWFALWEDFVNTTPGTSELDSTHTNGCDVVTGFNMDAGKGFYTIEMDKKSGVYLETFGAPQIGVQNWNQEFTFAISKLNAATRCSYQNLISCANCKDIVLLIRDNNGSYWLIGVSYTGTEFIVHGILPKDGNVNTTGKDPKADINAYTIGLYADVPSMALPVTLAGGEADIPLPTP